MTLHNVGEAIVFLPHCSVKTVQPIIRMGSTSHPPEDYIAIIPANTGFPIVFFVNSDVFKENACTKVMASLKDSLFFNRLLQT